MIGVSGRTIALKTPIKSCGDESARCSGSSRLDPPSVFSISIPPFTTLSTIDDFSFLGRHFGSSEPKQPPAGKMRLPSHETGFDLANSLHSSVTVTKPARGAGWRSLPDAASTVNCTVESCAAIGRARARNRAPELVAAQAFPDLEYGKDDWNAKKAKIGDYAEVVRDMRNLAHPARYMEDRTQGTVCGAVMSIRV
jgi:hypothetical protein